jgi:predicted nucleic acid-binding protein
MRRLVRRGLDSDFAWLPWNRLTLRIKSYQAGSLVNESDRCLAWSAPPAPTDDFLLALGEAGKADYLVRGDRNGLLALFRSQSHEDRIAHRLQR